ncbi:hypothetical protein E2542_SST28500 [Spatholobus suberectus]|nr:hypothetical protein E2542_SST28500 [Spatholobus suberectus]
MATLLAQMLTNSSMSVPPELLDVISDLFRHYQKDIGTIKSFEVNLALLEQDNVSFKPPLVTLVAIVQRLFQTDAKGLHAAKFCGGF